MRYLYPLPVSAALISCSVDEPQQRDQVDLLIQGATVIHPDQESAATIADIATRDGRIVSVGRHLERQYEARETYAATGKFVIPGLADMHSHISNGILGDEDDSAQVLARHLYFGNTTILNMGSMHATTEEIDGTRQRISAGEIDAPRLLAVGSLMTMPGSHPTTTIYSPELQAKIAAIVADAQGHKPMC